MRYGTPSIEQGIKNLQEAKVEKIVLSPMFPQYAQATSGSCIKKAIQIIEDQTGPILRETDIIRYKDIYGRVN